MSGRRYPRGGRIAAIAPAALALLLAVLALSAAAPAAAQGIAWEDDGRRIEAVEIRVTGLEADARREALFVERVRRTLGLYPSGEFDRFFADANLGKLQRLPGVAAASYEVRGGPAGGVVIWLKNVDWVIEVVIENLKIKQDLLAKVEKVIGPNCIVTTNTSGIPIIGHFSQFWPLAEKALSGNPLLQSSPLYETPGNNPREGN